MREIVFRAYDKTMKRYKPFDGEHDTMLISRDGKVDYYNLQNGSGFDEYILEQFTGLHDATKWEDLTDAERDEWIKSGHKKEDWKGRRIFEGDIIEFKNIDRQYVKGIVYYLGSCFVIKSIVADEDDYNLGGAFSTAEGLIKVIGTIHDNKMEDFK